jgi:ribosome biogenesis GTPase A
MLLDTPGVIPFMEKDITKQTLIGTINFDKVKDPESVVYDMFENYGKELQDHFNIRCDDPDEFLEKLAKKKNKLRKGGLPDTYSISRLILKDWQQGKIR